MSKDSSLYEALKNLSNDYHANGFGLVSVQKIDKILQAHEREQTEPPRGEESRNLDIDILLGWIAHRLEHDELGSDMNDAVKAHKFEEAAEIRDKRHANSFNLDKLWPYVSELFDKYQYYFNATKSKSTSK